jgi:hypothetical protein
VPSLSELFGPEGAEADNDFEFDMDKLMGGVDQAIAESSRFRDPGSESDEVSSEEGVDEDPPPRVEAETDDDQPSVGDVEAGEEELAGASEPPPPSAADPLGLLPPERRAALLAIDEVVQRDPAKRDRVLAALRDEAVVAPSLPEDIEEGSVAARLWHEQQETRAVLNQMAQGQRLQQEAFAKQAAVTAADAAGIAFAQRYPQLEASDIVAIAQEAGQSGLAAKLVTGTEDLRAGYLQALESTLWTSERWRANVLSVPAPTESTVADEHKEESKPRKRKLTALSSAASPVSAPATPKSPLETRVDGRLTPQSRMDVVREMATKLNRSQNEGNY